MTGTLYLTKVCPHSEPPHHATFRLVSLNYPGIELPDSRPPFHEPARQRTENTYERKSPYKQMPHKVKIIPLEPQNRLYLHRKGDKPSHREYLQTPFRVRFHFQDLPLPGHTPSHILHKHTFSSS